MEVIYGLAELQGRITLLGATKGRIDSPTALIAQSRPFVAVAGDQRQQIWQHYVLAGFFNQRRLPITPIAATLLTLHLNRIGGEVSDGWCAHNSFQVGGLKPIRHSDLDLQLRQKRSLAHSLENGTSHTRHFLVLRSKPRLASRSYSGFF